MMQTNSALLEAAYKDICEAAENESVVLHSDGGKIHQRRLDTFNLTLAKNTARDNYGRTPGSAENVQIEAEWVGEKGISDGLMAPISEVFIEVEGEEETWKFSQPWGGTIDTKGETDEPVVFRTDYEWTRVKRL